MRYIKEHRGMCPQDGIARRKKSQQHPTGDGCQHHPTCESCPHPDCIASDDEIVRYDAANKTSGEGLA